MGSIPVALGQPRFLFRLNCRSMGHLELVCSCGGYSEIVLREKCRSVLTKYVYIVLLLSIVLP